VLNSGPGIIEAREEANRKHLSKLRAVAELFREFNRLASYRVGGVGDTTLMDVKLVGAGSSRRL
jgi:hypothetical protein